VCAFVRVRVYVCVDTHCLHESLRCVDSEGARRARVQRVRMRAGDTRRGPLFLSRVFC